MHSGSMILDTSSIGIVVLNPAQGICEEQLVSKKGFRETQRYVLRLIDFQLIT